MRRVVRQRIPRLLARIRMPLVWSYVVFVVVAALGVVHVGFPVTAATFVVVLAVYLRLGTVVVEPIDLAPPVTGAWLAAHSPASAVPSHGVQAYGQTYAIDLVNDDGPHPERSSMWPLARRPSDFPGFGAPVWAPADAVVVRTHDWERDHWSRTSWPGLAYLLAEMTVRELTGPSRVLGNHVVLRLDDDTFALLAHLRRRSIRVVPGDRVVQGQRLADCGNSGNSTEPHVHFQVMDRRQVLFAAGLPFRMKGKVPKNGQVLLVRPAKVRRIPMDPRHELEHRGVPQAAAR